MCSDRNGKFVVPKKPAAGMGWWVGRILECGFFIRIEILRVQYPENFNSEKFVIHSTPESVVEFDCVSAALNAMESQCESLALVTN
jgi:hypothetical protein